MKKISVHYPYLAKVINSRELKSVVELGVWKAELSTYIFQHCPSVVRYYGVDPYRHWSKSEYVDGKNKHDQKKFDKIYKEVAALYAVQQGATLLRTTSNDAIKQVLEEVDMVFIDANHGYEWIKKDIAQWAQKVRNGGIVSGHDYSLDFVGVIKAVNEYCHPKGIVINLTPGYVWYFEK